MRIYAYVYVVIQEPVYACMPWAIESADTRSNCFWEPPASKKTWNPQQVFFVQESCRMRLIEVSVE